MRIVRLTLATLLAAVAVVSVAGPASAAIDPSASAVLASALKPAMQTKLRKTVKGLVVTKVKCVVPTTSKLITGKCTARFTVAKYKLDGVYRAKATLDSRSRLSWSTTSVSCTDSRTHKKVAC
jgi:hypothetical protein